MALKYHWHFTHRLDSEHRIFWDRHSLRLAIADNSGETPDLTDDGVLWISKDENVLLNVEDGKISVNIPVNSDHKFVGWVTAGYKDIDRLASLGLRFDFSKQFIEQLNSWQRVINLYKMYGQTVTNF